MRQLLFALMLGWLTLAAPLSASAASRDGLNFDDQIRLGDRALQLNGLGIRAVFIFRAYVAGLYLEKKATTGQGVLQQSGPKRLQLRMLMDIGAPDIKKALVDGMHKNVSEAQWAAMQDRVALFSSTIESIGVTHAGDTLNLDYLPEQGLVLAVNEVTKGQAIPGADFYNAMMGIFIGDDPVDTRLKSGLLGQ